MGKKWQTVSRAQPLFFILSIDDINTSPGVRQNPPLTALDILITLEGREGRKLWDSNKPDP